MVPGALTLVLGPHRHDITSQALVVAAPGADADGAGAVVVGHVRDIAAAGRGRPAVVRVRDGDDDELRAVAVAGATAIVRHEQLDAATRAGLPLDRIAVEADGIAAVESLHAAGHVVAMAFDAATPAGDPEAAGAGYALAVAAGCRVLVTADVRTARRAAAVIGAIVAAT